MILEDQQRLARSGNVTGFDVFAYDHAVERRANPGLVEHCPGSGDFGSGGCRRLLGRCNPEICIVQVFGRHGGLLPQTAYTLCQFLLVCPVDFLHPQASLGRGQVGTKFRIADSDQDVIRLDPIAFFGVDRNDAPDDFGSQRDGPIRHDDTGGCRSG